MDIFGLKAIVLSGSKTASTTIKDALIPIYGYNSVLHIHHQKHMIDTLENVHKIPPNQIPDTIETIIKGNKNKPLLIISIYREPMMRTLSSYCQRLTPDIVQNVDKSICIFQNSRIDQLNFNEVHEKFINNSHLFDENYEPYEKIQLLYPFDPIKGYSIYEDKNVRWILLRFDQSHLWQDILRKHVDPRIVIPHSNKTIGGKNKPHATMYQQLKQNLRIPYDMFYHFVLRHMDRMNLMYYNKEKQAIFKNWSKYCDNTRRFYPEEALTKILKITDRNQVKRILDDAEIAKKNETLKPKYY